MKQSQGRRSLFFGGLLVLVAVVGVTIWALTTRSAHSSGSGQRESGSGSSALDSASRGRGVGLTASHIDALAQRASLQSSFSESGRASLHNAIADTLLVYASGTYDDWLAYLDSYGIPRPEVASANPEFSRRFWNMSQEFFGSMALDDAGVAFSDERLPSAVPINSPGRLVVRRARARRAFPSLPQSEQRIARIIFPGEFTDRRGEIIQGELQMSFEHDPERGVWIFTEVAIVGSDPNAVPAVPSIPL